MISPMPKGCLLVTRISLSCLSWEKIETLIWIYHADSISDSCSMALKWSKTALFRFSTAWLYPSWKPPKSVGRLWIFSVSSSASNLRSIPPLVKALASKANFLRLSHTPSVGMSSSVSSPFWLSPLSDAWPWKSDSYKRDQVYVGSLAECKQCQRTNMLNYLTFRRKRPFDCFLLSSSIAITYF